MIRDLNYTRLYYIALVIVPAGKGPIPHLTRLSPRLRAARRARVTRTCARYAPARHYYMRRLEPDRTGRHHQADEPTDEPTDRRTDRTARTDRHHPVRPDLETETRTKRHGQKKRDIDTVNHASIMRSHQGN